MSAPASSSLKAILGPTNTGKTYFAIERMLAHRSGMIGLPLRLLAREVYHKLVDRIGAQHVALVTGEERIVPPAALLGGTVEAMPLDVPVECVAIDEIQVATDFDRGHVFTNRILHARGLSETLLLGAATMAPVIRRAAARCRNHLPAALFDADLCGLEEDLAPAPPHRHRRLLGDARSTPSPN
jgi:ATP-dependent RNA helicase SUPV3L1/SUV3